MNDTTVDELPLGPESALIATRTMIPLEPVAPADVVSGAPEAGAQSITELGGTEIGIWEITPGVVTDTEVEEVFVVLSGTATVEFLDTGAVLALVPGSLARLPEGARTRWTVTSTLRKVYLSRSE
ncbi:MAG TPA: cupin domain-containing protein [Plantibacter sp.]|uniref:cupin domain-containing protein n=1 Tax=Plantibacter sp. TaxID=1871045 RepID=UPI002B952D29|nr:cupin domain-containing protein [Plantibacter sp.]